MRRRLTNLLHLLVGLALLAGAGYFLRELASNGRIQLRSFLAEGPAGQAKFWSGDKDPASAAAKPKVYGVLAPYEAGDERKPNGDRPVAGPGGARVSLVDRVADVATGAPNHFLHGQVTVEGYRSYEFEVPADVARPELDGTWVCGPVNQRWDRRGSVEVSLMDEEEFARFAEGRSGGKSTFSAAPTMTGDIEWDLKPTFGSARKYYLVFRNASRRRGPVMVDADFTLRFE